MAMDFIPMNLSDSEIIKYFDSEFGADIGRIFAPSRKRICDEHYEKMDEPIQKRLAVAESLQQSFISGRNPSEMAAFSASIGSLFGFSGFDYRMRTHGIPMEKANKSVIDGMRVVSSREQELLCSSGLVSSSGMVRIYRRLDKHFSNGRHLRVSGGYCDVWSLSPRMVGSGSLVMAEIHVGRVVSSCLGRLGESVFSKPWPYVQDAEILICSPIVYGVVVDGDMSSMHSRTILNRTAGLELSASMSMSGYEAPRMVADNVSGKMVAMKIMSMSKDNDSSYARYRKWFGHPSQSVSVVDDIIASTMIPLVRI
jgi:hypothetical protein